MKLYKVVSIRPRPGSRGKRRFGVDAIILFYGFNPPPAGQPGETSLDLR